MNKSNYLLCATLVPEGTVKINFVSDWKNSSSNNMSVESYMEVKTLIFSQRRDMIYLICRRSCRKQSIE